MPEVSAQEWAQKKNEERSELYEFLDIATRDAISSPESFKEYLDMMVKMDMFSPSNALLIYAQFPQATNVRTFDEWKDKKVSVNKGEEAIAILESNTYEKADGTQANSYSVKKVFDVQQTNSKFKERTSVPVASWKVRSAYIKFYPDKDFNNKMPLRDIIKSVVKDEISKNTTYDVDFKTECAAYMLMVKSGIENPEFKASIPAHWENKEEKNLRKDFSRIKSAYAKINKEVREQMRADIAASKER